MLSLALLLSTAPAVTPPSDAVTRTPLARLGEPLQVRRYAEVQGDGPVVARFWRRAGPIEAWTFPDGTVASYRRHEGDLVVEQRRYDAWGGLRTVTDFSDGEPTTVTLHDRRGDPLTVDVSGWEPAALGPFALSLPPDAAPVDDATLARHQDGATLAVRVLDSDVDPASDAFRDALVPACACALVDRASTWVDGLPGVRYRVRVPDLPPREGVLWAVPHDGRVLLVSAVGPAGSDVVSLGRTVIALTRREAP